MFSQKCSLRLVGGFGFEFLSVDFVLAIEPIAKLVIVAVIAVFDGGVIDS